MPVFALNLFDLADNDDYLSYSRRSSQAVANHGGKVTAIGRLAGAVSGDAHVSPRRVMILVEWPSADSLQAFIDDPSHADLHPLRESGTENYLWWTYERLDDLRPILRSGAGR